MTLPIETFRPSAALRNPHLQSVLAGLRMRRWAIQARRDAMGSCAKKQQLSLPNGACLEAYVSRHADHDSSKGVFVMLHGWEGSHLSVYIYSMAVKLFNAGFDVVRLNLRDHGDTHNLNEGLFHAWRVEDLTQALLALYPEFSSPMRLIGYSLGGNFALRAALSLAAQRKDVLSGVYGICPVLNPGAVVRAIDRGQPLYLKYFLRKWQRSLQAKQRYFPELYDFEGMFDVGSFEDISREWIKRGYGPCDSLEEYFAGYAISADELESLPIPTTVLTAATDPIIPVADFQPLRDIDQLNVRIAELGGHCGFVERLPFHCWLERELINTL